MPETHQPKGKKSVALSGTVAGNTAICTVGLHGNDLHYRGYDILDFAGKAEFEEVAHLLIHEWLPRPGEYAGYKRKLKALRGERLLQELVCRVRVSASPEPVRMARTSR